MTRRLAPVARQFSILRLRGGPIERSVYFARLTVPVDVAMAVWKGAVAASAMSLTLFVFAAFGIGVAVSKVLAVRYHDRAAEPAPDGGIAPAEATFRKMGTIVVALASLYVGVNVWNLFDPAASQKYDRGVALAIATVATVEVVGSVMGAHAARRNRLPVMESLKLVNVAACCVLVVLTQTALLSFAHRGDASVYNAVAGIVFGCVAVALGFRVYTRRAVHSSRIDAGPNCQ